MSGALNVPGRRAAAVATCISALCVGGPAMAGEPEEAAAAQPDAPAGGAEREAAAAHADAAARGGEAEAAAEPHEPSVWESIWSTIHPSTKWYLHFASGQEQDASFSRFSISRGYLTLKLKPVEWFESRITMDTHQDDTGDWKVRLKYLYGKFKIPIETAVLTEPNIELGMVHGPWFDYEEHINNYRAEGKMHLERNDLLNSADLGATVGGLIGPKLDEDYQERVSSKYPGKYGSFAFGVYNGGGYHASEENENKVFMARASLRPLGFVLPHWQASYFVLHGKGNTADGPDWYLHNWMTSVEHEYFVLAGQIGLGRGNQQGTKLDDWGAAAHWFGWSVFGELKLPWIQSSLIGRFDSFDWDTEGGESPTQRVIAGHAFHFLPHNFLMVSLDHVSYGDEGIPADRQAKLTLQVAVP